MQIECLLKAESLPYTLIVPGDERNTHTGEMAVQAEDRCEIKER